MSKCQRCKRKIENGRECRLRLKSEIAGTKGTKAKLCYDCAQDGTILIGHWLAEGAEWERMPSTEEPRNYWTYYPDLDKHYIKFRDGDWVDYFSETGYLVQRVHDPDGKIDIDGLPGDIEGTWDYNRPYTSGDTEIITITGTCSLCGTTQENDMVGFPAGVLDCGGCGKLLIVTPHFYGPKGENTLP